MQIASAADYIRMTRDALGAAGFERKQTGGTVYWAAGKGRPIVLVHGVNDQAGSWFAVAPALAARARVVLPDLAGHGDSEPRTGEIPIELLLTRLEAVIDAELGPSGELTLVGNSLGGWLAMLYTLAHPERVTQLVLEGAGGLDRPFGSPVVANTPEGALSILRAVHGPRFEAPAWLVESVILRASESPMLRITGVERHYVDARLAEIRCPATLLWGADDGVLPVSYAEALRNGIAGAKLTVIPGAAHIPHLQQPAEVLRCLTAIC